MGRSEFLVILCNGNRRKALANKMTYCGAPEA